MNINFALRTRGAWRKLESGLPRCITHQNHASKLRVLCVLRNVKDFYFYGKHDLTFAFFRKTWLLAFSCEYEPVFQVFRDTWKGQLLMRETVFRRNIYREWLAQLVRNLPSNHKVPCSILGFAEIRIFVRPSSLLKLTQLSILPR